MSGLAAGDHAPHDASVAERIHAALAERIERGRADEEFQQRLKRAVERQRGTGWLSRGRAPFCKRVAYGAEYAHEQGDFAVATREICPRGRCSELRSAATEHGLARPGGW